MQTQLDPITGPPDDPLTVLVVDDEHSVLRQLVDGLRMCGNVVQCASSGPEALTLLAADPRIGAVMTDIRMPGLDGMSLAQRIMRERDAAHAVEVVLMTGHATVDDAAMAVRTRVADFLRKPFRLADAAQAIAAALSRAQTRRRDAAERDQRAAQLRALEQQRNLLTEDLADASRRLAALIGAPDRAAKLGRDIHAISHALRTPLNAIAGGADLLVAASAANDSMEYLSILREGVHQARDAVGLVEELSRVERPGPATPQVSLDLTEVSARIIRQLLPDAARRGIILAASPASPVGVQGDQILLPRAVELCVGAALEWAQPGARIAVELNRSATKRGEWAVMTVMVSSSGTDGEAELPDDIVFPETGSVWSRTQEGLRFAIARHIAEQHRGRLTSWNGPDGSMALRLILPL